MRILNREQVVSHGFEEGRRIVTDIMEHGLQAADPYVNTSRLLHLEGNRLYVGDARFEADHDPQKGMSIYDLTQIENVYIVGAGKGVQRVAKALEEALGDHLTGGCVIAKHGDPLILEKTEVVFGAHPIPDEGCVKGCERIKALSSKVTEKDLVFTIIGNGGSSLLTMPEEGISLEDVKRLTAMMQIQKGVTTIELNAIRNHVDQMKGGKMTRLFSRAQCVHIVITDANHHVIQAPRHDYEGLMTGNVWLHNLPEGSTFADAVEILHRYDAWEECPQSIRDHLLRADPAAETVKFEEFRNHRFRVFGVMPDAEHFLPTAVRRARELGLPCHILTQFLQAESSQCARVYASIAKNIEAFDMPFQTPVVLLSSGEMLVTVEKADGIGGRNQEFALQCAREIAGHHRIVMASVDSDGTDGPGGLRLEGAPSCLGGGIVDGYTWQRAQERDVDIHKALKTHATFAALWRLDCGLHIEQNISLNDLTIIYIG